MTRRTKVLSVALLLIAAAIVCFAAALSHDSPCRDAPAPAEDTQSMRAIVHRCYGPPDIVKLERIAKPVPADDHMLVKVHAASVNPLDWHYMRGKPYLMRLMAGFGAPREIRLGVDFAGTVESVGKNVRRFKPGDEVFGGADGAFAEYVTVRELGPVASKPPGLTFEQAAAVPIAAITALQALRDRGAVKAGQKVLINGASGGVGTFAVQIAKDYGAEVTGVCSTRNVALVRSLGADHVIDYTQEDFTRAPERYDLIIDTVGTHTLSDYRHVLNRNGALVMVGALSNDPWLGPMSTVLKAMLVSPFVHQKLSFMLAKLKQEDLGTLRDLMQEGKLTSVIDRRYELGRTSDALRYVELGHARGKVIVTVD